MKWLPIIVICRVRASFQYPDLLTFTDSYWPVSKIFTDSEKSFFWSFTHLLGFLKYMQSTLLLTGVYFLYECSGTISKTNSIHWMQTLTHVTVLYL